MQSQFQQGRPEQCQTCIFRHGGIQLEPERLSEIISYLAQGYQHQCHSSPDYACRGGRDIQLRVFCAMGFIDEPTDEALRVANQQYLEG